MKAIGFKKAITIAVIILVSLSLIVSNWMAFLTLKTSTMEQVQQSSKAIVKFEADGIAEWFDAKATAIAAVANHYQRQDINQQYVSIARLVKEASKLYSVFWGFEDGSSYASVADDAIWNQGVADPTRYDPRPRGWYKLALESSHPVLTDIYTDMVTKQPVISIVTNLGDGVLSGDIGLEILDETVKQVNYPGAVTIILDQSGKALASNSPIVRVGQTLTEVGLSEVQRSVTSSDAYQGHYIIDGQSQLVLSHAIPLIAGQKWFLLVSINTDIAYANVDKALNKALITSAIMLLVSIALVLFILHWLYQPIMRLKTVVLGLSEGQADLTMRLPVTTQDDLGHIAQGINQFIANLQGLVKEVLTSSQEISDSIENLKEQSSANTLVLKNHVQETEQVVAAVEEMSATANDVANNTSAASQASGQTSEQVINTNYIVLNTGSTVQQLIEDVEMTETNIANIAQDTESITKVLQVIGEIAGQTNLLALNAAIEAARAGEQGRGFAVVADEVRALAARTQTSTAEIEGTLTQLQLSIDAAVSAMKQTKYTCEQTSITTKDATDNLDKVVLSVAQVSDLNIQIATAAEEQSVVSEEISRNMATIRDMASTLDNNGKMTVHEAVKLTAANEKLIAVVNKFTIGT